MRELYDLGLRAALPEVGVQTRDYGFYTRKGLEIWTEPRVLGLVTIGRNIRFIVANCKFCSIEP